MAPKIKLSAFVELRGESKQTFANRVDRTLRTVYNWLNDEEAEYIVHYDARNNQVLKVVRSAAEVVYPRSFQ